MMRNLVEVFEACRGHASCGVLEACWDGLAGTGGILWLVCLDCGNESTTPTLKAGGTLPISTGHPHLQLTLAELRTPLGPWKLLLLSHIRIFAGL